MGKDLPKPTKTEKSEKKKVKDEADSVTTTEVSTQVEELKPAEIDEKTGQLILTEQHKQLIKNQIAPDATDTELDLLFMMARRTRLDPLIKQLYFMKYRSKKKSEANGCECGWGPCTCGLSIYDVSYVTSIDGYRIIAHRTGSFAGIDEPEYKYDKKGNLTHCTVRVYRVGSDRPFAATVKFSEYNTGKNLWPKMPETMIAKVAEAHALRKAFPQDLSGIYTADEMEQAEKSNSRTGDTPSKITKGQVREIQKLMSKKGVTQERVQSFMQEKIKIKTLKVATSQQADRIIEALKKMPDPPKIEEGEVYDDEVPDESDEFTDSDQVAEDVFNAFTEDDDDDDEQTAMDDFNDFAEEELKKQK